MVRSSGVRIARHHAACRTVDTKPRRGILADDPVSDRFGRRRCLRPLRGCGKGGAVEFLGEVPFVRTERWGIGGFRYHWLCSMFRTLSQPLPVPKNGTFSLSRAQSRTCSGYAEARKRRRKFNVFVKPNERSRTQFELCHGEKTTVENKRTISLSRVQSSLLELPRREMEHENEGIIEAFRRGGRRRPRLFVGAGPFTSPECRPDRASDFGNDGLSSLKGLYFFSVRSGSIYCISCD